MRTLFLLNPAAGKQDCTAQLIPQIEAAARRAGLAPEEVTIHVTEYAGHARKLARAAAQQAAAEGVPLRIYTAGGDGTFMEAMTGVQGIPGAAVGCLPYGSGGEAAYLLSIVEQLCGRIGRTLTFTIDEKTLTVDCLMCAICNGKAYGGGFLAGPEAVPDDGWLDVFIVRKVGRLTIAKLLSMYKNGRHFVNGQLTEAAKPYFIYRRAKRVSLRPADGRGPIVATADGECAPCSEVTASLQPLAGRILLPKPAYERFCAARSTPADVTE